MSEIRLAVVGVGYWGKNVLRSLAAVPGARLKTVCDLDPRRLASVAESYPSVATTSSLAEVLSDTEVDAVAVVTPAEGHRAVAEACLRAGKHVFVEKPLTDSSEDAEVLVKAAETAGLTLMVGHLFLFDPAVRVLLDSVRSGAIGEVRYVHSVRTSMGGTARLDTNIIWDALIHDAYILRSLFGSVPVRVLAVGQGYLSPAIEDIAFVTFDFGGGRLGHVYAGWYALEKARRMTVVGSDAILAYDDLGRDRVTLYNRGYEPSEEKDAQGRPRWRWRDEGGRALNVDAGQPLLLECRHFVECVAGGSRPITDGVAGLEAVRIIEACQRSLRGGNAWAEVA